MLESSCSQATFCGTRILFSNAAAVRRFWRADTCLKNSAVMKRSLSFEMWIRRAVGVAVILGVVAIALGLGTKLLTTVLRASAAESQTALADEGPMPDLGGAPST